MLGRPRRWEALRSRPGPERAFGGNFAIIFVELLSRRSGASLKSSAQLAASVAVGFVSDAR